MNKTQTVLAAIGGTVVVGALVLGYFIWDASSVKAANAEALDDGIASARRVMEKLPVKPEKAELTVFSSNASAYDDWRGEAAKLAARGDLVFGKTTPAEFKTTIVGDARKIAALPGCFDGRAVKADFGFGFKDYVTGGAMPPEKDLGRLQREWNDVMTVLKAITACCSNDVGIADVRMGKAKAAAAAEETAQPKKRGKKKIVRKAAQAEEEPEEPAGGQAVTSFAVDFMARPAGLVRTLNALTTDPRFIVVENCTFTRESDALAAALGGDAKKDQPSARSGRGRRARGQSAPAEKADDVKSGVVTDPATAPFLKVTLAVSVYDFGTLEEVKAKGEGEEEGEAK